jgi:hypothetical protein
MAQSGYTPILIYASGTATNVPLAADLTSSANGAELALNYADGKLYFKNSSGVVTLLASSASAAPVTTISFGSTGLTPATATSGAVTVTGTLAVANGGTGQTSFTAGQIHFGSFSTSANLFWDNSNTRLGVGTNSPAVTFAVSSVDAMLVPVGTTGQRPTGATGYFRFNSTTAQFEGFNGTTWGTIGGGAALSNDTSTATALFPLFASATSGNPTTIFTSNAKLLYTPSTGELNASEIAASNGLILNNTTVSTSYTIVSGYNALSVGPITVASGATVTVSSGQRWIII